MQHLKTWSGQSWRSRWLFRFDDNDSLPSLDEFDKDNIVFTVNQNINKKEDPKINKDLKDTKTKNVALKGDVSGDNLTPVNEHIESSEFATAKESKKEKKSKQKTRNPYPYNDIISYLSNNGLPDEA